MRHAISCQHPRDEMMLYKVGTILMTRCYNDLSYNYTKLEEARCCHKLAVGQIQNQTNQT